SGGLVSGSFNSSAVTVQPTVDAHIESGGVINASSNIHVFATDHPEGDAITRGVSVGVGALGGSQSSTTIHPTVTSYLKAPTVRAGGEIKVHATATPTAGFVPNYQILSTDASDSLL